MNEGNDGADDRSAGDGGSDQRWEQPWPGELEEDHQDPSGQPTVDSRDPDERERAVPEDTRTEAGVSEVDGSVEYHPNITDGVEISESARSDGRWIDLSEREPGGETLAAGDLPEEKLTEYITDRRSLHSLVQIQWGVRVLVGAVVAGLAVTWLLGALGITQQFGAVAVGLFVVVGLVWVVLYYRLWHYQIRADAIYLERGVVTHVRSLVPYVRIQHVDTKQGVLERMLGLSTLVVYTAGSRGADVSIPGLMPEEARDLQRRVKELAIEAEGDDAV